MTRQWTRTVIIREILDREAEGLSLSAGQRGGVDSALYQAAKRVYGSWREALLAAGIAPHQALPSERWSPQAILNTIRKLAKRKRPCSIAQLSKRYAGLVPAARRIFGSWPKAIIAAGVDPKTLCCISPWTRERIIEAILIRAIRNEPIGSRTAKPRSLVDAGQRLFGSWAAAKQAAGLNPDGANGGSSSEPSPRHPEPRRPRASRPREPTTSLRRRLHRPRERWTTELVLKLIRLRLQQGQPLNAATVGDDDKALYRAATRRYGNWTKALIAAGLNPDDHWRHGQPPGAKDCDGGGPVSSPGTNEPDAADATRCK